jgi:integrase
VGRFQQGYIYEKFGAWHVRYYATEVIDGEPKRVQKSHRLCAKDDKYHSKKCKAVQLECQKFMHRINVGHANEQNMTVADFWDQRYLPFIEQHKKASTVYGYTQIWNQHLKAHFAKLTLQDYKAHLGHQFLLGLADTQGRRTLLHVKSLASGIFKRAINEGRLELNPWRNVELPEDAAPSANTLHYTLEEAEDIISALIDHVDCQLVMAMACFLGLRPGEIAGLQWGDFDKDHVHIRRAWVRGKEETTKTPESVATLPLVAQVKIPLQLWRMKCGNPKEGWLFPTKNGTPVEMRDLVARKIRPILKTKKLKWKSLYAGRRGAATAIIGLTNGNYVAAQELLRHKNMTTTLQFYKKQTKQALADGLKALEAALTPKALVAGSEGQTQ